MSPAIFSLPCMKAIIGSSLPSDRDMKSSHVIETVASAGLSSLVTVFGDEGKIYIDGASSPNSVSNDDKPADATVSISWDDFLALSGGKLDPMMAFMQGKLKIAGDMMLVQKLAPLLKR